MEKYLRVNLLGPGPRLMEKEFTGPRSDKVKETLAQKKNYKNLLRNHIHVNNKSNIK